MSTQTAESVVVEFDDRQPEPPRAMIAGRVVAFPADIDEEGAVCSVCGYWGIVPARTDVLEALTPGAGPSLVCATCSEEVSGT